MSVDYQIGPQYAHATASWRVLDTFDGNVDESKDWLRGKTRTTLRQALEHFPELSGETVTVVRLDPKVLDRDQAVAQAGPLNRLVYLPTSQVTTLVTMYHELAHLAIAVLDENGADVPTSSEEFCSLFAMARMPVDRIDEERIPYFDEPSIEKERWPEVCRAALEYREHNHANIQQAQRWLDGEEMDVR